MIRRPPRSTRTDTLFPYTTLFRSLVAIFLLWLVTAFEIYGATLGPEPPASAGTFLRDVFTTGAGWTMIIVGIGVGFLFAVVALAIGVVSFPLLLDRNVGLFAAVTTSALDRKSTRLNYSH